MSEHTHTPSVTKQDEPVKGVPGVIYLILFFIIFIIIISLLISSCSSDKENPISSEERQQKTTALVLKCDKYTPFTETFDYKFELDTQGDPIKMNFPGIKYEIMYSGKGTIKVPPRKKGPVRIESLNPNIKVRVRIWEVITVNN